jgi:flagellar hook assembly protein FlgD
MLTLGASAQNAAKVASTASNETTPPSSPILAQNYPNPFTDATTIRFDLPREVHVRLTVYNMLGRPVSTLVDKPLNAGSHEVAWAPTDGGGDRMPPGLYIYRLEAGDFRLSRSMVVLE